MPEPEGREAMERAVEKVRALLSGRAAALPADLAELHAADLADIWARLEDEERDLFFDLLPAQTAATVLSIIEKPDETELVRSLDEEELSDLLEEMPSDDAAEIVGDLPDKLAERVLDLMEDEDSAEVQKLLQYPEDSAGRLMTTDFLALPASMSAGEALRRAGQASHEIEMISVIYCIDERRRLTGVLSLRELLGADPASPLSAIMELDLVSVPAEEDQEEVARVVARYDLLCVPVVDHRGVILGIVTVDDVIDVITEEATEDIYRMGGTDDEELFSRSPLHVARVRLPWLITCLIGGMAAATILRTLRSTLDANLALVFFVPIITGMGGNVGIQSSTIVVRGLATGRVHATGLVRVLLREVRVGAIMGVACGIVVGLAGLLLADQNLVIGAIVAIAMFCAITVAATVGTIAPLTFRALGLDPAIAAGPFVTTANDVTGLIIYLSLASYMLGRLVA